MAKFYGPVGYAVQVQTAPGVFKEQIKEYSYFGDLLRNIFQVQSSETLNDDLNISNEISILADPFARENFHRMRYVVYMGTKWKIKSVDASQYPRLILKVGGVYNAEQGPAVSTS